MRIAEDFELDDLPEEQARTLLDLLDDVDFAELPENLMGKSAMPDEFTYTVTVEAGKWKHTVITGESSAPEKLRELLQMLNQLARKHAGKR